jgi:phosphomannomutase
VVYAKVGEANVVKKILENNCGAGGEGSSGGYIEPSFVVCRDGVYASTLITKMIKEQGSLEELVSGFKRYSQDRAKIDLPRELGPKILEVLSGTESDVDTTDGVKIRRSDKSWVLIRASNTENVIRISAEAKSPEKARELVQEYSAKIRQIGRSQSTAGTSQVE